MVAKIKAAVGARRSKDFFIIARTDARAVHGLDEALRRGEQYLKAGADGIFIEAPQTVQELERVGRAFQGVPQIANMLEGGGQTPVLPPAELKAMGFAMAAYPTTLIFRVARTIERALADIKAGKAIASNDGVNFAEFKDITNYDAMGAHRGHVSARAAGGGMRRVACVAEPGAGRRVRRDRRARADQGAARGRRPDRALLSAAHRHRPARLLQG